MPTDPIIPGPDPTIPPRFHEIGEYRFQRFVTDLMGYEPDIATSDEYGLRGQGDRGADVIARRSGGDGQEVASCKCYEKTSASQIRDWSDEFLVNWDEHWRNEDVRRFVLATTALNSASRSVQDQVTAERKRFAAIGVAYEMWSPVTLVAKVRPHRAIATTYLTEFWADRLCGPLAPTSVVAPSSSALVSSALIGQLAELQQRLSAQAMAAADRAIDDLRSGRATVVRAFVDEQRDERNWSQLDPQAQARLLRLAASLALRSEDVDEAERLSHEADGIAPADEPRLAAHIAYQRADASTALGVLGNVSTTAGRQFQAAMLIVSGDLDAARTCVEGLAGEDASDAETVRLQALLALASNERDLALLHIRQAEFLAPQWTAVRQLGAIARYACALSPALPPEWFLAPNAFDSSFVLEDAASQAMLGEAVLLIDRLVEAEPNVIGHRVWRLAILSAARAMRGRAREEAEQLLPRSGYDPTVVAWCLFRGIDVDLAESERELLARYRSGTDMANVRVLGMLLSRGDDASAAETIRATLDLQVGEARTEALEWISRFDPDAEASGGDDPSGVALRQARALGDWGPVSARLAELTSGATPSPAALPLAEAAAAAGRFDAIEPHVDGLLAFRTAVAVRLAVLACYNVGDPARALRILDGEAGAFGEALPAEMRRLRADALARAGDFPAALREADGIAGAGTTLDRLFRAEMLTNAGDVRAAVPAVDEALEAGLLTGDRAWRWSRIMQSEEPGLARRLLEKAVATGLDDRFAAAAMQDAIGLRLDKEAGALMTRVHERAAAGSLDVRTLSIEDIPAFLVEQQARADEIENLYLDGVIPSHLRFASDPVAFALLHLGPNRSSDGNVRPWPIRHGGRPDVVIYDLPWSSWRLHMDLSALLVAARLELLDAIEGSPSPITVPAMMPTVLLAMETGCRSRSDAIVAERILAAPMTPFELDDVVSTRIAARTPTETTGSELVSLLDLVSALSAGGAISTEAAAFILHDLDEWHGVSVPAEGAPVTLDGEAVGRLASGDALAAVTARFDVRCDGSLLEQAVEARDQASTARAAAETLGALRRRIATGLETGRYRTIAQVASAGIAEDAAETPLVGCLQEIVTAPGVDGGVAWVDDRLTTGYVRTTSMPVAGVADVLEAMRLEGRISPERQELALDALRAAGALFMIPSSAEVSRELKAAPRRDQRVIETPQLAAKRRAIAQAALNERRLAVGEGRPDADRPHETVPMQTAMRLLANCLKDVWLDDGLTFDDRVACSDWLWLNARRTNVGRVVQGEEPESRDAFAVIQIAHCLDQAVDIGLSNDRRRIARLDYLRWLWLRAIVPLAAVDPGFPRRLGQYLADFYFEMMRGQDARSPRDRRLWHVLMARRVHRLPEPIQAEIYRDPRMRMFGASGENVTVSGHNFDPAAFWREVRRARLYGRGRLRTLPSGGSPGRTVRVRREGEAVVLTGAVRARLADPTIVLASLRGLERDRAIEAMVVELRLEDAEAGHVRAQALASTSMPELVRVMTDARAASAAARYADIRNRLARRERVRLDLFGPAPFGAVLASMGLADTTLPFAEALAASRLRREAEDTEAGLLETAGVPVLRDVSDDAAVAASGRACTPLAIVHAAAAARATGMPDAVVIELIERLLASVERSGGLFVALLRWTQRHFVGDTRWREAPAAYALAAMWAHADRLLDIVLGTGLDASALADRLNGFEPPMTGSNLLLLQSSGVPDVAWPFWMSPAALLNHSLAAVFDGDDPREVLGDDLMRRLTKAQLSVTGGAVGPEVRLLLRRSWWPNAMGSFLTESPAGFTYPDIGREQFRADLIDAPLTLVEVDPSNRDAWFQLAAFSAGGLEPVQADRLINVVEADPGRLARLVVAGGDRAIWRTVLQPIAWRDPERAIRLAVAIASACRHLDQFRPVDAGMPISPADAGEELVELASIIAAASGDDRERVFVEVLDGCSRAWPALTPVLHDLAGNLTARTPSSRATELWRLQNLLGSR